MQPVSGKLRQRSVAIVFHASGRQIVGARGRGLVAGSPPGIRRLHRRSTVRELFALDANALAQPVAESVLPFETGLRRIRSNSIIFCSSDAADVVFSHSYREICSSFSEVFAAIASIFRRYTPRPRRPAPWRHAFSYWWTKDRSRSSRMRF